MPITSLRGASSAGDHTLAFVAPQGGMEIPSPARRRLILSGFYFWPVIVAQQNPCPLKDRSFSRRRRILDFKPRTLEENELALLETVAPMSRTHHRVQKCRRNIGEACV
jgi:hypothetical protein